MSQTITNFCRQVRARSTEHQSALTSLLQNDHFGVAVGLLRQELDSLIRVAYLCEHGASSLISQSLIADSVNGNQWATISQNGHSHKITDREMVNLASQLGGWVNIIYSFGCKLIHLSNAHDYKVNDPFAMMPMQERREIAQYLHDYHQYPENDINQTQLALYLPKVMQKLVDNVECYVSQIESSDPDNGLPAN